MVDTRKLKGIMAENGVSQARLAKEIGITTNTLSRKLCGKSEFNTDEAKKICDRLGVDDPVQKSAIFLK